MRRELVDVKTGIVEKNYIRNEKVRDTQRVDRFISLLSRKSYTFSSSKTGGGLEGTPVVELADVSEGWASDWSGLDRTRGNLFSSREKIFARLAWKYLLVSRENLCSSREQIFSRLTRKKIFSRLARKYLLVSRGKYLLISRENIREGNICSSREQIFSRLARKYLLVSRENTLSSPALFAHIQIDLSDIPIW